MAETHGTAERDKNLQRVRELAQNAMLGSGKQFEATLDYESDTGNYYSGTIIFKKPNAGDLMKMAGIKSRYIQSQFIDEKGNPIAIDPMLIESMLVTIAEVVSTLKVVVVQVSEGLTFLLQPENFDEMDVLMEVYGRYQAWRNSFRTRDRATSGQADGGTDAENAQVGGAVL